MIVWLSYQCVNSTVKSKVSKALDLGTINLNNMIQDIGYLGLYMSILPMFMLHNIQHAAVEEIKPQEHTVCDQLKQTKNTMLSLQNQLEDK